MTDTDHDLLLEEAPADQAMTEIALALAMAFFSIMVLTMVSMGIPQQQAAQAAPDAAIEVAEAEESEAEAGEAAERTVLVHFQGRYFDAELNPVSPEALDGPLTLAVSPDLPLQEALAVREALHNPDVMVSTLDQRWLDALKETTR